MTIEDTELIKVQNLTDCSVGYRAYTGQHRYFEAQQVLPIPAGELRQLNYTRGGRKLIQGYLGIRNRELAIELGIEEPDAEYSWELKDIDNLLQSGSTDALEDALEFGPEGIVDTIVSRAVALRIDDMNKRRLIKEYTSLDVDNMIAMTELSEQALENEEGMVQRIGETSTKRKRRVPVEETEKPKQRRVTPKAETNETSDEE